jgi:hypothetical protein
MAAKEIERHRDVANADPGWRMKYGDQVILRIPVKATIKGAINERDPTGSWWVQVHGEIGLRVVHESDLQAIYDDGKGY